MAKAIRAALGIAAVLAAFAPAFGRPPRCPDNIIVQFYGDDERAALAEKYQCAITHTCRAGDFHRVGIPAGHAPEIMVELFQAEPHVECAELNYYADIFAEPNDTYYSFQWHMQNDTTGGIYIEDAWAIETGDPNVIVAVVDTGVAYEDFDRFRQAPDLAGTSFVPGYDFINDDEHPNDDQGHGTHVAGTIGQSTDNGLGVAGVAFGCSIMPIKALDANGVGDHFTIARGLIWAADHGAKVINLSLGSSDGSRTLEQAVAYAYRAGVTVVCAAGNEFRRGNAPSFPAAYDDYCIAVGATRYDDRPPPSIRTRTATPTASSSRPSASTRPTSPTSSSRAHPWPPPTSAASPPCSSPTASRTPTTSAKPSK